MADGSRRLFVALWPEPALAERLHQLAGELQRECGGRRMRQDTLHLTLAFIGDVPEARVPELLAALAQIKAPHFRMQLDALGYWCHNHIVWAGGTEVPPALRQLADDVRRALAGIGLPASGPAFVPHMTLLRKAHATDGLPEPEPVSWDVDEWVLVESSLAPHGADYRRLAAWALD